MKRLFLLPLFILLAWCASAQEKTSAWLEKFIRQQASPFLLNVLNQPDTFQYQFIYTQINRDKNNTPHFTNYYLHVDRNRYFNPASMVKLPVALLALEKINTLKRHVVNKYTTMITDSGYSGQTSVLKDTSAENGLPSVAQYIRKIFLVSDNDAYNRLYEFNGQQFINERLWQMGYKDIRITRRFVAMNADENRHTNPIWFMDKDLVMYQQQPAYNTDSFDFSKRILIGKGYMNGRDSLINTPMDFTTHNNFPLEDMQQILQSALFPKSVSVSKRFHLQPDDYNFVHQYMSELPSESVFPHYDTAQFFDSYTKFFLFKAGRGKIPSYMRVFNKTGWSYGFLTDVAYIVDFNSRVEFMVSGVIYVNSDGILNDDKYEYEQTGYPFFKELGNMIYQYELERKRKFLPDLGSFQFRY